MEEAAEATDGECLHHQSWMTFVDGGSGQLKELVHDCLVRGMRDSQRIMQNVCLRWPDTTFKRSPREFGKCMLAVEFAIRRARAKLKL